jgi:HEAT repeat protein
VIRRFGVTGAHLMHPLTTIASLAVLAVAPVLPSAVLARVNHELVGNAIALEVRGLLYNGLPLRLRGSLRALIEGVLFYAAMAAAGLGLMAIVGRVSLEVIAATAAGLGVLYLATALRARRAYLDALLGELARGHIDLEGAQAPVALRDLEALAEPWERAIERPGAASPALFELARRFAAAGLVAPVREALANDDPAFRAAALRALNDAGSAQDSELRAALRDDEASVRLAAAEMLSARPEVAARLADALRAAVSNVDARVSAQAAVALGPDGHSELRRMALGDDRARAAAAIARFPAELAAIAVERLDAEASGVRAAALGRLSEVAPEVLPDIETLARALDDDNPMVRRAALRALASTGDEAATAHVGVALEDPDRSVRSAAADGLGRLGAPGLEFAVLKAESAGRTVCSACLQSFDGLSRSERAECLAPVYAARVERARRAHRALATAAPAGPGAQLPERFLRVALEDEQSGQCAIALDILERIEDRSVVQSVRRELGATSKRSRGDAIEALVNLGDRDVSSDLAAIFEGIDELPAASALAGGLAPELSQLLASAQSRGSRWLALAARSLGRNPLLSEEEHALVHDLLALRDVPLFTGLSLDQLEAVSRAMVDEQYLESEVIVREGDRGGALFVLIEGSADAYKDHGGNAERRVNRLEAPDTFGAVSIVDELPRGVTIVAASDLRVRRLDAQRFRDLLLQVPEISLEVMKELAALLRAAEERA